MGLIPKKTKADTKLGFAGLTFNVFLGMMMTLMISLLIGQLVHSSVRIWFNILCAVVYLILSLPSRSHPRQRIYQSILSFIKYQFSAKQYMSIATQHFEETKKEVCALEKSKARKDI